MERHFLSLADGAALALEFLVILAVCAGALETVVGLGRWILAGNRASGSRTRLWVNFAQWLMLALEFALGADIIRTAISPTWDQLGQLAVVAVIRTGLGYFLQRDADELGHALKAREAE